jgi:hypothetical protein
MLPQAVAPLRPGRANGIDMLKLLLDEHISPDVADGLRRRHRSLVIRWMAKWEGGGFLGKDDSACLLETAEQGLVLVTYDRRTIPPLLKMSAEEGRRHGGVIIVDEKTLSPADIGGLIRALFQLFKGTGKWDWTDRVVFCGTSTLIVVAILQGNRSPSL